MFLSCSALAKRDGSRRRKERRTERRMKGRTDSHPTGGSFTPLPRASRCGRAAASAPAGAGGFLGSPRSIGATEELPGRAGDGQGGATSPMPGSQDAWLCVHKFFRNSASETHQDFRNMPTEMQFPAGNLCRARDEARPPLPCCTLPRAAARVPPRPSSHCSSLDFPLPDHPLCSSLHQGPAVNQGLVKDQEEILHRRSSP